MNVRNFLLSENAPNLGLLVLRVGIGAMFIAHGMPKLMGGQETWAWLGSQMQIFGISFGFRTFGLMAALAETMGGLFLIFGLLTRITTFFMFFTMFTAVAFHLAAGDGFMGSAHPIELGIVFLSFMIMGAGKFSLDNLLFYKK